ITSDSVYFDSTVLSTHYQPLPLHAALPIHASTPAYGPGLSAHRAPAMSDPSDDGLVCGDVEGQRIRLHPRHARGRAPARLAPTGDRKSTRLNSSHVKISYAVFCLKKKKIII